MARKPHNYAHFQNLVNELKDQNKNNIATIEKQLEVQSSLLYSMRGLLLKEADREKTRLRTEKENELEEKKEGRKGLNMKSKLNMPRFSGKGFMGMLGNFLSTALLGIPGGLRRFMPRSLGLALLPKLARGVALLVAGPSLIKALQAGFDQNTFSGGVEAFINSYFAPSGGPYKSLAHAAAGGVGKGALIGFGLLGPRGAVIGGLLGGALTSLNHIFAKDKSKMDSGGVVDKMKEHLVANLGSYAKVGFGIMGAKMLMPLGLPGMIAGAILGAGIGMIGAGAITEMIKVEAGGEKDLGVAFRTGLKNWYSSEEMRGTLESGWPAGLGAAFGLMAFSKFGPHAMLAGAIFGAAAGMLGGPILAEAIRIDNKEGKGMANAMKTATFNYLKSQAKNPYVVAGLSGAIGGATFGAIGTLPGMIAGAIIGAVFGVMTAWIAETVGDWAAIKFKSAFGITEFEDSLRTEEQRLRREAGTGTIADKLFVTKTPAFPQKAGEMSADDKAFKRSMEKLKTEYMKLTKGEWLTGNFRMDAATVAAKNIMSPGEGSAKKPLQFLNQEIMALRLLREYEGSTEGGAWNSRNNAPVTQIHDGSVQSVNINQSINQSTDYQNMDNGLYDGHHQ